MSSQKGDESGLHDVVQSFEHRLSRLAANDPGVVLAQ